MEVARLPLENKMTISIYDADICKNQFYYFNLDVMKVAAYYKIKKNELVVAAPTFTPERFNINYYVQDGNGDHSDLGAALRKDISNQIIYMGLAFTNDVYKRLPPEIEKMEPDLNFYDSFQNNANKKFFELQKKSAHLRLSLDGKEIDSNALADLLEYKNRSFFLHDVNLFEIKDAARVLGNTPARFNYTKNGGYKENPMFYSKFPIHLNGINSWQIFNRINFNPNYIKIQFDGIMDYEVFKLLGSSGSEQFQNLYYNFSNGINFEKFLEEFLQIYRQTIFIRNRKRNFLLIYDPSFFKEELWKSLIFMWTKFLKESEKFTTFAEFWGDSPQLQNFKKLYPDFWKELETCRNVSLKGGKLVNNDWTRN